MPPTPRRRSVGNPRPPPPPGWDFESYFTPRPFLFGMVCAFILLLAGVSISPSLGHVGVSSVVARDTSEATATPRAVTDHMSVREACGLPSIKNFKCQNGEFMGHNEPITDLQCDVHLYAVEEPDYHPIKRIRLMNQTRNDRVQYVHDLLNDAFELHFGSPVLHVRWMDDKQSAVSSFSLRKGTLYPHLANKNLDDWYAGEEILEYEFMLRWRKAKGLEEFEGLHPTWFMVLEKWYTKDESPWDNQPYPAKLQYICIDNNPTLALWPADGYLFFNTYLGRPTDEEGNDCNEHAILSPGATACLATWSIGDNHARLLERHKAYHVIAKLVDPRGRLSGAKSEL